LRPGRARRTPNLNRGDHNLERMKLSFSEPRLLVGALASCVAALHGCGSLSTDTWYQGARIDWQSNRQRYICETPARRRAYYVFFGLFRLGRETESELFPEEDRYLYLFRQTKTGGDWWLSIFLGTTFSVTSNTIEVQRCLTPQQYAELKARGEILQVEDSARPDDAAPETTNPDAARARARERADAARRAAEAAADGDANGAPAP
jgi:hypothetical protein